MQLHQVKRNTARKISIKVGRGGTRGKTSGRGHKGQRQHGGHGVRPDVRDTIKKFPKIRGRGKNLNTSAQAVARTISIATLSEVFEEGTVITPQVIADKNLVKRDGGKTPLVKILSDGEVTKKFSIEGCQLSEAAKVKIEKAGGSVK
jgi:large subunit ribosomal protein L15